MSPHDTLKTQLYQFSAHIRDPEHQPRPDNIEDRRMAIYRDLFFNNVDSFLSNTFPVLRTLYEETTWRDLVRNFYSMHRCQTPYFLEISREFLDYLQSGHKMRDVDPPFLFELAHYEWVELALSVAPEQIEMNDFDSEGSLLEGHPVISPHAWILTYSYPVHRITAEYRPDQPGEYPTCIIVYRDNDDEVRFTEINPVTAKLLQQLESRPGVSGNEILLEIAAELGYQQPGDIIKHGTDALEELKQKGIILGATVIKSS